LVRRAILYRFQVDFRIRLEENRLCALVMIGVCPDGTKELIAIEDGYRASTESWAALLSGLKRRGMRWAEDSHERAFRGT
jgi:transposase-like protein